MGRGLIRTQAELDAILARNRQITVSEAGPLPLARERGGVQPSPETKGQGTDTPETAGGAKKRKTFKSSVEAEYSLILKAKLSRGEISAFDYEAITIVIGDPPIRFTPDFFVVLPDGKIQLIEVKGPFMREDSIVKFKSARKQYPCFEFQLWQRAKGGEWSQLI